MNEVVGDGPESCCKEHRRDVVVGVCPFCLNEKLLVLSAKQTKTALNAGFLRRKPSITLPNLFAFGSFLHRLEFLHRKSDGSDLDSFTNPEGESFISIKIGDDGVASWDNNSAASKGFHGDGSFNMAVNGKEPRSVVEFAKPHASLRWRRRIGQLLQVIRRKRSSQGSVCHVEGVKVGKGWKRGLPKKKAQR